MSEDRNRTFVTTMDAAARTFVAAWEAWVALEPSHALIVIEMLVTWKLMAESSGLEPDVLRATVIRFLEQIDGQRDA